MKINKSKFKPYTLKCGEGVIAEVSKGAFIGTDENGEFTLVDDICDGYIGVEGELEESIEEYWKNEGKMKGYPRIYKVVKELTISDSFVLCDE